MTEGLSRRNVLAGAAGLAFAGPLCAQTAPPVRSMLEMRHQNVVIQEWDLSCGAATLATILRYQFNDPVGERELVSDLIQRDIYIDNPELVRIREGFSLLDLKRVVEKRGYYGFGYGDLSFSDALGLAPVITPITLNGYNHFVVLIGVVGDRVHLADPAFGNTTMRLERFLRVWMDLPGLGHVGFIVSRDETPSAPGHLVPDPRVMLMPPPGMVRKILD